MSVKWSKTQFPGVRYREHSARKHNGKPDRYFTIRYKVEGKLKEEGLGWSSQDWNAQKASLIRSELIKGYKSGEGPSTLSEKRKLAKLKQDTELNEKEKKLKDQITFGQFFNELYFPQAKTDKTKKSYDREEMLFRLWINPVIGELSFKDISPLHLEKIKDNMAKKDRSPRSVRYALAVIRQVFNRAKFLKYFEGVSPIEHVKMPQADNKRLRFLTHDEAMLLLNNLKIRSIQLYEISLISLRTGARANEIFSLKWGDVNIEQGTLTLWDTKNTKTRMAYMTDDIKELFLKKERRDNQSFVFQGRDNMKIKEISHSFNRAVEFTGLNKDITDPRMKVVFHTLRHTFASWLVEKGVDLYTVKELMGHSTLAMTERYSHIGNNTLQNAIQKLGSLDNQN